MQTETDENELDCVCYIFRSLHQLVNRDWTLDNSIINRAWTVRPRAASHFHSSYDRLMSGAGLND